jgi:hypothetical protein
VKRFVTWLIVIPAAVLIIGFAIANRTWVDMSLDPFDRDHPALALHMPLWGVTVLGLFLGVIAGWVACWLKQSRWRRMARELKAEAHRLRSENARLEMQLQPPAREAADEPLPLLDGP